MFLLQRQSIKTNKLVAGFTLIELLVVISIIGLLASIVLVSLNSTRAKARDAKRFADLKQIQNALHLYYDTNGGYPLETCNPEVAPNDGFAGDFPGYDACQIDLETKLSSYIAKLPLDPLNDRTDPGGRKTYWYGSQNNGKGYVLLAVTESGNVGEGCYYPNDGWYCIGNNWQ